MEPVYVWLMVFIRTAFILGFFPIFGEGFAPIRVRVMISLIVSLALAPVAPIDAADFPATAPAMAVFCASEALLGFSLGFVGKILFAIVRCAGQLGGAQMGFGIVNAIDPTGRPQISVVADAQHLLSMLIFLATDAHHVLFSALAASFEMLDPGSAAASAGLGAYFAQMGRTLFSLALQFAMPVIIVVFAIDVAMAMLGRAVPQIDVFIESFPPRIVGGLLVTIAALTALAGMWANMFEALGPMLADSIRLMAR
jgi:flagellar biosynthetic protein FliR